MRLLRYTRFTCMPGTLAGKLVVDRTLLAFLQFLLQESLEEPRSLMTLWIATTVDSARESIPISKLFLGKKIFFIFLFLAIAANYQGIGLHQFWICCVQIELHCRVPTLCKLVLCFLSLAFLSFFLQKTFFRQTSSSSWFCLSSSCKHFFFGQMSSRSGWFFFFLQTFSVWQTCSCSSWFCLLSSIFLPEMIFLLGFVFLWGMYCFWLAHKQTDRQTGNPCCWVFVCLSNIVSGRHRKTDKALFFLFLGLLLSFFFFTLRSVSLSVSLSVLECKRKWRGRHNSNSNNNKWRRFMTVCWMQFIMHFQRSLWSRSWCFPSMRLSHLQGHGYVWVCLCGLLTHTELNRSLNPSMCSFHKLVVSVWYLCRIIGFHALSNLLSHPHWYQSIILLHIRV